MILKGVSFIMKKAFSFLSSYKLPIMIAFSLMLVELLIELASPSIQSKMLIGFLSWKMGKLLSTVVTNHYSKRKVFTLNYTMDTLKILRV